MAAVLPHPNPFQPQTSGRRSLVELQASGLRDRFESGSGRRLLTRLHADEWTSLTLKSGRALALLEWLKKEVNGEIYLTHY